MSGMDINEVLQYLPHRYPFLLIDRVISCEAGKRIVALKNVTITSSSSSGISRTTPSCPA